MKQYLEVLEKILNEGVEKESGRANMPNTIGISKADISMDLSNGFPLLTTKKMYWKGIVHELLWFLRGESNIKYLVDNKVNIWNGDAYRWYLKHTKLAGLPEPMSMDEFIHSIKTRETEGKNPMSKYAGDNIVFQYDENCNGYQIGDLGKVYGYQWRNQNGIDQVQEVLDGLKSNPYSRYHIIDGWNKADFVDMALPPCHLLYQFIVRPLTTEERWDLFQNVEWNEPLNQKSSDDVDLNRVCDEHNIPKFYLDLNMYQRSCDTALGVPFNIASMSLLLMIFAKTNNMIAGIANWIGGDTHLYVSHIDTIKEQLNRIPQKLPEMVINKDLNSLEDICDLHIDDFDLVDYQSYPKLDFELFFGLKKKK